MGKDLQFCQTEFFCKTEFFGIFMDSIYGLRHFYGIVSEK